MPLAVLSFLVSIAYWPGLPSASVDPRWWVILIGAPLVLATLPKVTAPSGFWIALLFLDCCLASLAFTTVSELDTIGALVQLLGLAIVFQIGASQSDLRSLWLALGLGATLNAGLAGLQALGLTHLGVVGFGSAGLFLNRDILAEFGVLAFLGLLSAAEWRRWWFQLLLAGSATAAILPGSRGAWVALAAALFLLWAYHATIRQRVWILSVGGFCLTAALAYDVQTDYWRWASLSNRLGIWDWTLSNMKLFGWGFGTYGFIFNWEHAHNEFLELAFELGIGSILFWLLVTYALGARLVIERLVLVALLVQCLVSFPLHNPVTAFIAAIVLGRLCSARRVVVAGAVESRVSGVLGIAGSYTYDSAADVQSSLGGRSELRF